MQLNILPEFLNSCGAYGISILALTVSGISLFLTLRRDLRDRPILKTRCQFYRLAPENIIPGFIAIATNVGQRPIALMSIGAKHPGKHNWYSHPLDGNTILKQSETYRYTVMEDLFILELPNGSRAESLWFEDTTGKRHHIKHSAKYLRILHKHYRTRHDQSG
jgi:hypothetical protein